MNQESTHDQVTSLNPATTGRYSRDESEESLRNLRRSLDKDMRNELKDLRDKNTAYTVSIVKLESEISEIKSHFEHEMEMIRKEFSGYVEDSKQALFAAQTVAQAGLVGRNFIYFIVSVTAAIGGLVAVWELIKKWGH